MLQLFKKIYLPGFYSTYLYLNNLTSIYPIAPMYTDTGLGNVDPTGNKTNTSPCPN